MNDDIDAFLLQDLSEKPRAESSERQGMSWHDVMVSEVVHWMHRISELFET